MIKLVAFDWNGTLLDDTKVSWKTDNVIFKHFGKKTISLNRFKDTFDIPVSKLFLANGFTQKTYDLHSDEMRVIFYSQYEKLAAKAKTRTGAKQLLNWLKAKKVPAIIFSNHPANTLKSKLKYLKIEIDFAAVLANDFRGGFRGRNKQEKLVHYIRKNRIKPQELLIVGDTIEEIEIARELKAKSAAITGGYNSTKLLRKYKPDYLIKNLLDLKKIVFHQ